jgi:hypothetical protein
MMTILVVERLSFAVSSQSVLTWSASEFEVEEDEEDFKATALGGDYNIYSIIYFFMLLYLYSRLAK